ncbi:MAG: nucleotidyltransferase domain-containing protein [Anaerolineae bacterium]|nr:nucleotidyltransferase domain-containing protein [Candidatus Roseilinea sp.]MDW8451467.1 nucleotidyltransferase domain-containing protein [Anaerolineae bacterium]
MSTELTPDRLQQYRATARARLAEEAAALAERRARAWELAREAAALLKHRFGATRVVVFGSLIHKDMFTLHSDVDIAAWGLRERDWLKAIGAVYDLSAEIPVNLVDMNLARPEIAEVIEREGVEL